MMQQQQGQPNIGNLSNGEDGKMSPTNSPKKVTEVRSEERKTMGPLQRPDTKPPSIIVLQEITEPEVAATEVTHTEEAHPDEKAEVTSTGKEDSAKAWSKLKDEKHNLKYLKEGRRGLQ